MSELIFTLTEGKSDLYKFFLENIQTPVDKIKVVSNLIVKKLIDNL